MSSIKWISFLKIELNLYEVQKCQFTQKENIQVSITTSLR